MRRRATILLHWTSWISVLFLLGLGPVPWLAWLFGVSGLAMTALAVVSGLMSGPGHKLQGALRTVHPWMHRAMYAGLALAASLTLMGQMGFGTLGLTLETLWFTLIGAGMLHGIFHLWRHTALGDGALRRMTPKTLHGIF
ncbi:MAG: hypothetical protein AB3N13_05475 [Arenibacterium sp.]